MAVSQHSVKESRREKISIGHKRTQRQQRIFFFSVLILFIFSIVMIDIDGSAIAKGMERLPVILASLTQISFEHFLEMLAGMVTTVVIAFLAVLFSFVISFFLAFLVANNTTPNRYLGLGLRYAVYDHSLRADPDMGINCCGQHRFWAHGRNYWLDVSYQFVSHQSFFRSN